MSLWDAKSQYNGVARKVSVASDLHSSGIFSLHYQQGKVVTGSKDKSICLSELGSDIKAVGSNEEVHCSVVKCVRFRPDNNSIVASVGNDSKLAISDFRKKPSTSASVSIEHLHNGCAVNSVSWHPTKLNLLMTAGFDTAIQVHDLRNTAKPCLVLNSHMPSLLSKSKGIYHPQFFNNGKHVITSGDKSK